MVTFCFARRNQRPLKQLVTEALQEKLAVNTDRTLLVVKGPDGLYRRSRASASVASATESFSTVVNA